MLYIHLADGTPIHAPDRSNTAVVTGTMSDEINMIPSLTFRMYPDNPAYNKIKNFKSWIYVENLIWGKEEFYGRAISIEEGMETNGEIYKEVVCEGYLGCMQDTIVTPIEWPDPPEGSTKTYMEVGAILKSVIDHHNETCGDGKEMIYGGAEYADAYVEQDQFTPYVSTWTCIADILENYGLYLHPTWNTTDDTMTLMFYDDDHFKHWYEGTITQIGKNLLSGSILKEQGEMCSRLWCYGAYTGSETLRSRVGIESVNDGKGYLIDEDIENTYGIINGIFIDNDEDTPATILADGKKEFARRNKTTMTINLSAVDLFYCEENDIPLRVSYFYDVGILDTEETIQLRLEAKSTQIEAPYQPSLTFSSATSGLK